MEAEKTKNAAFIVAKKDLKLLFKSKRRIFLLLLIPFMIILMAGIGIFTAKVIGTTPTTTTVWVVNESPSNVTNDLLTQYHTIQNTEFVNKSGEYQDLRTNPNAQLVLYFPSNFTTLIQNKSMALVFIDYATNSSIYAQVASKIAQITESYEKQLIRQENSNINFDRMNTQIRGFSPEEKEEGLDQQIANNLFIIPVYIIFLVVVPPISLIMISVTIEREQRTLETLFLQPVSRQSIIAGKILYGVTIILSILILDILAVFIAIFMFILAFGEINNQIVGEIAQDVGTGFIDLLGIDLILLFIIAILLIGLNIIGLTVLLSLLAKDEKEANMISGIIPLFIFAAVGVIYIIPIPQLGMLGQAFLSSLPIIGILISIYVSTISGGVGIIALISSIAQIAWAAGIIWFTARLSEAESILELTWSRIINEIGRILRGK